MAKVFKDSKEFNKELNSVYLFHQKVYDTIIDYLKKHGDRVITDEDNEKEEWNLCFLDVEGSYEIKAIRFDEKRNDFYLDAVDESNDKYRFSWEEINYDMCIERMILELIYPKKKK